MSKSVVQSLIKNAQASGILSPEATKALMVRDIGAEIEAGMGVTIDDVQTSEVVLVTIMPDDSGSIRMAGNAQAIRDGHNLVIEAMTETKQVGSILAHTRYLNGDVLYPYCPIPKAEKMTAANYDPNKGTPLYDQSVVLLGTVVAKAQEFADAGISCRTITLIITDGADCHSTRNTAADVARIVHDMLRAENHIIAAMGISDGATDFMQVFRDMGIPDEWIFTPDSAKSKTDLKSEIRKGFQLFSQSAVRASQSAASFSKTALGGFGG